MSEKVYLIIWGVYLFSVIGLVSLAWNIIVKIFGRFTPLLIFPFLALLLTPSFVEEDREARAPAFIIALFEEMQGIGDGWVRAGVPLILSLFAALIAALLWVSYFWLRQRKKVRASKAKTA